VHTAGIPLAGHLERIMRDYRSAAERRELNRRVRRFHFRNLVRDRREEERRHYPERRLYPLVDYG
jgi:hypothetical protein